MAGLNIANELLKDRRKESGGDTGLMDRVRRLSERVESAITRGKQLEI
jgi:cell division protein ZapA (FtsZ GTPase activity inhibitor)